MSRVAQISVAVAACDRPEGLARCLDAIHSGEAVPAEVIVVDQSASDACAQVAERYQGREIPLVYIRQPRMGLSASRNAAIARAIQPVVAVTDDDCVPDARWVAVLQAAFSMQDPPVAVTGKVLPLGPPSSGLFAVSSRTSSQAAEYRRTTAPWIVGTGANCAFRREWVVRVGGYDRRLGAGTPGRAGEDADLLHRLLTAGVRVRYEPRAVIYHERQNAARHRDSRPAYGHGIGACCALWMRRGDWKAPASFCRWVGYRMARLAWAAVGLRWRQVRDELLVLRGSLAGLWYGVRVGGPA